MRASFQLQVFSVSIASAMLKVKSCVAFEFLSEMQDVR